MNSEKVTEIKECLEEFKDDRIGYCTNGIDRFMLTKEDVLTLINELESENERLKGTAKEILQLILNESGIDILGNCYKLPTRTFNKIKRQFGVEVEE